MATVVATTSASPAASQPHKSSSKRVFRSISRFLSGGGSTAKQRPKLPHAHSSGRESAGGARARPKSPRRRSSSRASSRSRRTSDSRDDDDDTGEDGVHRLAPSQRSRGPSVSARSGLSGADTDASIYAMSPSTRGPSSIHSERTVDSSSHDASSLAPTHASTHKSYASTKPTTLLSIEVGGVPGANRIAVVPGTGSGAGASTSAGLLGASAGSQGSQGLSFASAPPSTSSPPAGSPLSASVATAGSNAPFAAALHSQHRHRPSSSSTSSSRSLVYLPDGNSLDLPDTPPGVPSHTFAHPRNNPHPGLPPADNASVLTLASSSFAPSLMGSTGASATGDNKAGAGARSSWTSAGGGLRAWSTRQARSLHGGGGGSGAKSLLGGGPAPGPEADEDASVRALAGSRRASDESLGSRSTWSAVVSAGVGAGAVGPGGSRPREGSVRSRAPVEEGEGGGTDRGSKERRGSMRTVEKAPSVHESDGAADAATDAGGAEKEDPTEEERAGTVEGDKGKKVDAAEHVGAAPALAATAATFGLPLGGDLLARSAHKDDSAGLADRDEEQKAGSATEASTPRGEKDQGAVLEEAKEEESSRGSLP